MIGHDPTRTYRAAVIGAGSGGLTLAIGLAEFGHDVVLVEAGRVGGDCTNVGCVPSKTLLHAAAAGIDDPFRHVRARRDELHELESAEMEQHDRIHLVRGRAALTSSRDPHVVDVTTADGDRQEVRAEHVVVCTGSRPVELTIDGLAPERLVTNESLFEMDAVPGTIVLVGGGAISLEMATAFRDLGSEVHIVELADRLLGTEDPLVSETIRRALVACGVIVHIGTSIERFDESSATAHLDNGDQIVGVDRVLMAVGQRPRLDDLGLDAAGVDHDDRSVTVDDRGRTSVDGLWAVGDVTGDTQTTHGAGALGRRVVRAIALPRVPRFGGLRAMPNAVYCRPEIASVGMTPDQVSAMSRVGRRRYEVAIADIDRGFTDSVEHGVAIVDVERFTGRILRVAIVGPAAAEIIGIFTLAIDEGVGLRRLFGMIHPYPAYAEVVGRIADDFARDTYPALLAEWWAMLRGRIRNRLP